MYIAQEEFDQVQRCDLPLCVKLVQPDQENPFCFCSKRHFEFMKQNGVILQPKVCPGKETA